MTDSIKRVVVPLDAASETRTAIDTAARLAARWRVPLHGIFIEDEDLVCLAGLPFARQVALGSGPQPLTRSDVEGCFRAFVERTRQELATAAERHGVKWSFAVMRGPLTTDAVSGAENDFVVAGAATRPIGAHFRVPSRWWSSLATIVRPFLFAQRAWETGGSVFALLDRRGPEAERALDLAAQIAAFGSGNLTVAAIGDIAAADDFAAWVSGLLAAHRLIFQTEAAATEPAALRRRIIELDCRLLVLEAMTDETRVAELRDLAEQVACDVLIIR
jgi:hypothetical protein